MLLAKDDRECAVAGRDDHVVFLVRKAVYLACATRFAIAHVFLTPIYRQAEPGPLQYMKFAILLDTVLKPLRIVMDKGRYAQIYDRILRDWRGAGVELCQRCVDRPPAGARGAWRGLGNHCVVRIHLIDHDYGY